VGDFAFVERPTATLPRHRRSTLAIAGGVHITLFALLILVKTQPVRVSSPGSPYAGIAAYVGAATGASTPKPVEAKKTALTTKVAKEAPKDDQFDEGRTAGSTGVGGGQPGAGPVRLGTGGTLTLLKKVKPIYPPVMQSVRIPGLVVLDAIIHSDGTIGDITVLRSTNDAFARAAIDAVKQWRYTPLPYEGIVTVTVNFTLA
jgi:TonB family protein